MTRTAFISLGVGLNTKVGTARFIGQLSTQMGSGITPHAPALLKPLFFKSMSENSSVVRKSYATAIALVAKNSTEKRVQKMVQEAIETYQNESAHNAVLMIIQYITLAGFTRFVEVRVPLNSVRQVWQLLWRTLFHVQSFFSGDRDMRQMSGMILKELNRQAPQAFRANETSIIPVAFLAKFDDDASVASTWKGVWEEGVTSNSAAARIYSSELSKCLMSGLASQHWGKKAAAASVPNIPMENRKVSAF